MHAARRVLPEEAEQTGPGPLPDPLAVLRAHYRFVAIFLLLAVVIVGALTWWQEPRFAARALLLIEPGSERLTEIGSAGRLSPLSQSFYANLYYKTEHRILQSDSLILDVIEAEGLRSLASGYPGATPDDDVLIQKYKHAMGVRPLKETRLVELSFTSADPELSARIVNAHIATYVRRSLSLEIEAGEGARRFLESSLDELRGRVEEAETTLAAFRRERGIVSLDSKENVTVERLAALTTQLGEAEALWIARRADMEQVRRGDYDSIPAVVDNRLIEELRLDLSQLRVERAQREAGFRPDLSEELRSSLASLSDLDAQINELSLRLDQEIRSVVGSVEREYLAAAETLEGLREAVDRQKDAAIDLKDSSARYSILLREVETNRALYESVLQRLRQVAVAAETRPSKVFVIDAARVPAKPSSPRRGLNLLVASLIGLVGGFGVPYVREALDRRLRTPRDVRRALGLSTLAVVPDLDRLHSPSALAEGQAGLDAYRTLRTAIALSRAAPGPQVVLFTSARRSVGKTTTVANSAMMFARAGAKVLVIDADLRRPRCHELFGCERDRGLSAVLQGTQSTWDSIQVADGSISFLASGPPVADSTELLDSGAMRDLVALLRGKYDYVLIDSPPIGVVPDPIVLSGLADGVVLVVDQAKTSQEAIEEACSRIASGRGRLLGVVLNRVRLQAGEHDYYLEEYRD